MKKPILIAISAILACMLIIAGCGASPESTPAPEGETQKMKVALLLSGSLGDMSFLDSANAGMKAVSEKYGIEVKVIEMGPDASKYEPTFLDISEEDYDIIIGSGWQTQEPIQNVAPDYPDKKYIIYDAALDYSDGKYPNVYSITYKQNEGSFLAGCLATKMSKTGVIGFLGGAQGGVIDDFMVGYIEGAKYANPDIRVLAGYINSFVDSAKCKEMALSQYNQGNADFIFSAAGAAGLGTLDAAKEAGKFAIGADADQAMLFNESDPEKANVIPTSVMKRIDNSLIRAFDLIMEDKLAWGSVDELGLKDGAVGLSENEYYEKLIPAEIREEIRTVSEKIISGEITVDTAFGKDNSQITAILDTVK